MNTKSITITLLSLSLVTTAMGQNVRPRPVPARPAVPAPSPLPARSTRLFGMISRPSIPTTAKSDDLVESPATNVIKGAFGYTLGAIWDQPIPDGAVAVRKANYVEHPFEPSYGREGEVVFPVEPKSALEPFSSVKLSVSTNDHRIAAIAGETPRMAFTESYTESSGELDQIANDIFDHFAVGGYVWRHTNDMYTTVFGSDKISTSIIGAKLYREYLKNHPDDPDFTLFRDMQIPPRFKYAIRPIAGSFYNEKPLPEGYYPSSKILSPGMVIPNATGGKPDYLQQIWQPFELSASYYPYAGEAVIRFSVRDIEDRTEHTNLVTVAELKQAREKEKDEAENQSALRPALRQRPGLVQSRSLSPEEQEFKDSLYRLSFADAVEKAKDNDPEALLRIALAYVDGKEVNPDYSEGLKYLEKASSLNYNYAQFICGLAKSSAANWRRFSERCRDLGLNTAIDRVCSEDNLPMAVQHLEQAVSNGLVFAKEDLEYVRERLKAQKDAAETKHRNAELLKELASRIVDDSPNTSKSISGGGFLPTLTSDGDSEAGEPPALRQLIARTNNTPVVCGVRLGEANDNPIYGYSQKGYQEAYEIYKGGEKATYSCLRCSMWRRQSLDETLFGTSFAKELHVSINSHEAYAVSLSHSDNSFEAKESDYLSYPQFKLVGQIAEVLKSKYGESKTDHSGDSKEGKRKWYFEKDGLYVTLSMRYSSNKPTTEQAHKGMRTYSYVYTEIKYIYLPALEAAIEEGREFMARPPETNGEGAKHAAERL